MMLCVCLLLSCGGVCVCVCGCDCMAQTSHDQHGDFQIFYRVGVGRSSKDG